MNRQTTCEDSHHPRIFLDANNLAINDFGVISSCGGGPTIVRITSTSASTTSASTTPASTTSLLNTSDGTRKASSKGSYVCAPDDLIHKH